MGSTARIVLDQRARIARLERAIMLLLQTEALFQSWVSEEDFEKMTFARNALGNAPEEEPE